jgi:hypothetical protein
MLRVFKILGLVIVISSCQTQKCDIVGDWIISYGRIARNYEMTFDYSRNRVSFTNDTIILASGFFYNVIGIDDEFQSGRYPYIYYGNKEKYKLKNDFIYIYSKPYDRWDSFKIFCDNPKEMTLIGKYDSVFIEKDIKKVGINECSISYIKANIKDDDLSLFNNHYEVTFYSDDKLKYQEFDSLNQESFIGYFNLRKGTFKDICQGFSFVDFSDIKEVYASVISEINAVFLEIGMSDGRLIKSEIHNMECSDELRLALVPILYSHQYYVFGFPQAK